MPTLSKASTLADRQVRTLLALSPSYRQLPPERQSQIAGDMAKIAGYLVEPEGTPAHRLPGAIAVVAGGGGLEDTVKAVDFPEFVGALISGVFQALVESSIDQMEAYGELLSNVADTVDQFADDNVSDRTARDWLARTYPEYFQRDADSGVLTLSSNCDRAEAITRLRLLPLPCSLKRLSTAHIETVIVPAARSRITASRQQLVATMVLMGANR